MQTSNITPLVSTYIRGEKNFGNNFCLKPTIGVNVILSKNSVDDYYWRYLRQFLISESGILLFEKHILLTN